MYLLLKLGHLLAVLVFLGNISFGLFWHAQAMRTRDQRCIATAIDGIIRSDRWFTMPGVVGIVLFGFALAIRARIPILGTPWIAWSLAAFAVSGVVFAIRVAPLQRRMRALAQQAAFDLQAYRALTLRWELWGALALVTPLLAFVLMVLKPT